MKVAIIGMPKEKFEIVKNKLNNCEILHYEQFLNDEIISEITDCELLSLTIRSEITKEVLDKLPKLKYIFTQSTGFDHIDTAQCKQRGIVVCNLPSYGERSIAEFTLGLIITLSRNIHKALQKMKTDDFSHSDLPDGMDLFGKTIGIVGTGKIGREVLLLAKAIGMKVVAFDVNEDREFAQKNNFEYVSFEKLLSTSDVISLHVPYTEKTHHLLNKEAFSLINKGALLINTARGPIVDSDALIAALENRIIGGAALDVLEDEKILFMKKQGYETALARFNELKKYNVIYTPHMAPYSKEAQAKKLEIIAQTIQNFVDGKIADSL